MPKVFLQNWLPKDSRFRDIQFRRRLSVFIICLLFSAFVWLVIHLSHDYVIPVSFPVKYSGLPKGQVISGTSDTAITFKVRAKGFQLLGGMFGDRDTVNISLSQLRYLRIPGKQVKAYLLTNNLREIIAKEINLNEGLVHISPDTLYFEFDKMVVKRLPVIPLIRYTVTAPYGIVDSIHISPSSILVSGPPSVMDTIHAVYTQLLDIGEITETQQISTSVSKTLKRAPLDFSTSNFKVLIPIDKFTESAVSVKVTSANDSCRIKVFPESITLHCLVAFSNYKKLDPSLFKVVVDCQSANATSGIVKPIISQIPSYVKLLRTEPPTVEVLILK